MRPELGPESPDKRASFSKATPGCPANWDEFSRALAGSRNGKKPLDFSGFCRCQGISWRTGASEPLGAAPVRFAIPVIAIPVVAAIAVGAAVHAHPALGIAMAPASPAAKAAVHMGQHPEPALLSVIQRLVKRVGRIGDLLKGGGRGRLIAGAVAQPHPRIVALLLAGIILSGILHHIV